INAALREGANGVMVGRAAYNKYALQELPFVCQSNHVPLLTQPLLNLFHSEPGNGLWKRKADTALRHCTVSHACW
ncbi:hypothetical protein BHM03_00049262, partial [Ensete ventricosum]